MGRWMLAVILVSLSFASISCDDDEELRDGGAPDQGIGPLIDGGVTETGAADLFFTEAGASAARTFEFLLSGRQVVPRVTTAGSAVSTVVVNEEQTAAEVTVNTSNLGGLTGAAIHAGEVGLNGPVIFQLISQPFTNPLRKTITSADLKPQPSLGIASFKDAMKAIAEGKAYLIVTTGGYPEGELRGQMGDVVLDAALRPGEEVPPVTSSASGTATVRVGPTQSTMVVTLMTKGLVNARGAFLHLGGPTAAGPVIFKLAAENFGENLTVTLRPEDLTPQPGQGILTFADAVDAVLAGMTYINVNTAVNPNGELRGHVGRASMNANLTGLAVVPPVTTEATALAAFNMACTRKAIDLTLTYDKLDSPQSAAIYVGSTTENGVKIFTLASQPFASPMKKTLTPKDLNPQASKGVGNMNDVIAAFLAGQVYVVITSAAHPQGEIRGQAGPY